MGGHLLNLALLTRRVRIVECCQCSQLDLPQMLCLVQTGGSDVALLGNFDVDRNFDGTRGDRVDGIAAT